MNENLDKKVEARTESFQSVSKEKQTFFEKYLYGELIEKRSDFKLQATRRRPLHD